MNTIASASLGTKFTYQMKLSGTKITITINGTAKSFTMPSSFDGEKFYFKRWRLRSIRATFRHT